MHFLTTEKNSRKVNSQLRKDANTNCTGTSTLKMEVAWSFETLLHITTWCHNLKDLDKKNLHHLENLKADIWKRSLGKNRPRLRENTKWTSRRVKWQRVL
jgi:hypothetical protein